MELKHLLLGLSLSLFLGCATKKPSTTIVKGNITKDTTWTSDTIYILDQQVVVTNGATLNIEPGTLIKANPGEFPNASMLIIANDSKINAAGTAEKPIVFTSADDNINSVYQSSQSLLNENNKGLWGGIIILGKAPISIESKEVSTFYVGLDPSDKDSYYGGEKSDDDSGVMSYVSIRYGGTYMGTGSESNGLTLCGVGSGTEISNIEVYANQDDGIEFFGGTVNASHLLVYSSGDDGIDLDEGYTGEINNIMVVLGEQSDSGVEISGGTGEFEGNFKISDVKLTVHTQNEDQNIMHIDSNSKGSLMQVMASNFLEVAKIQLQSAEVSIKDLQITKADQDANSLNEIVGGQKFAKNIQFTTALNMDSQKGVFDWTLTQQKVSL